MRLGRVTLSLPLARARNSQKIKFKKKRIGAYGVCVCVSKYNDDMYVCVCV
jgi:hypothetical protein